jgi:limonene-1,2-epoxide hydrolase
MTTMNAAELAELLVTRCREGKYVEAITELYAPDVRQIENGFEVPGGRDACVTACQGWVASRVIHQNAILGKHVTDDAVILEMEYDVTPHDTKQRQQWREAAVYHVAGGKITEVRFYYKPPAS